MPATIVEAHFSNQIELALPGFIIKDKKINGNGPVDQSEEGTITFRTDLWIPLKIQYTYLQMIGNIGCLQTFCFGQAVTVVEAQATQVQFL